MSASPVEEIAPVEVVDLEHLWSDEAKCAARHEDPRNKICTGEPTHIFTLCLGPAMVCTACAEYVEWVLSDPVGHWCQYCKAPVSEHWKLVVA